MNKKVCKIIDIIFKILPINKKQILFYSCLNQYNDNPKYIALKLHELEPDLKLIWVTGYLDNQDDIPSYMEQVKFNSIKYFYKKNQSAVVIDNSYGIFFSYASGFKRKLFKMIKNKKQINISTWHGTPYKCLANDEPVYKDKLDKEDFISTTDILIIGNKFEEKILLSVCNNSFETVALGNARTDILFSKDEEMLKVTRNSLKLPKEKRIVLYAPTFRAENGSDIQFIENLDMKQICRSLTKRFGMEWEFAVRLHPVDLKALEMKGVNWFSDKKIVNANASDDMMKYLMSCDILITDYSSSIFDFALMGKPCFLYAPDYDEYKASRGLYLTTEQLPFSTSQTVDELCYNIENFTEVEHNQKLKSFLDFIGNVNDGNSSIRAAEYILSNIKK